MNPESLIIYKNAINISDFNICVKWYYDKLYIFFKIMPWLYQLHIIFTKPIFFFSKEATVSKVRRVKSKLSNESKLISAVTDSMLQMRQGLPCI